MNKYKLSIEKYGQFIKFCIVGVINTGVSLIVFSILLHYGVYYLMASTVAYLAGIVNGYIFSSSYVFKKKFSFVQGIKFIGVYLSSLLINLGFLFILVDIIHIAELFGQLIVTGFNVVYNYCLNKFWTFKS
ncbi:GtrA family protein [Bacillus sp. FJAT-29814]|uniref:GtrA family protein n=1 Tax=Bacillus sp. FJAT-29814 TaxID=1729688 RepID=UPI000A459092|nr:GtrA family protein [Bacillus sp. FJAT-29814]